MYDKIHYKQTKKKILKKKGCLFFFSISAIVEAVVPLLDLKTNLKVNKDKFVVFPPSGHTKDAWH